MLAHCDSIRMDGDGGAGYIVAARAVDAACRKAKEVGLALCSTFNHGHVGSTGIYARQTLSHGLISWCVAGGSSAGIMDEQFRAKTMDSVWDAMAFPPLCFAVPSDDGGPPLVLDMNTDHFTGGDKTAEDALALGFHKSVFGSLGMKFVSTLLAGVLSGAMDEGSRTFSAATRGFMLVAIDPELIGDGDAFRASVREIIDASLMLPPMAGTDEAALPGTLEYRREQEWRVTGIPLALDHVKLLEEIGAELNVAPAPAWV